MIYWILEPLQYAFMQRAIGASLLISLTCAFLGVHVVHRRMAFLGDAIAHKPSRTGDSVAESLEPDRRRCDCGFAHSIRNRMGDAKRSSGRRHSDWSSFSGMLALGIVLISRARSYRDFTHMLFGNVLGVSTNDLIAILSVSVVVLLALYCLRKELMLTAVDRSMLRSSDCPRNEFARFCWC